MARRLIQLDGRWKLNPLYLLTLPTLYHPSTRPPWELKLIEEKWNLRYWVGGYFNECGDWKFPIVTVDKFYAKDNRWVQVEQYGEKLIFED